MKRSKLLYIFTPLLFMAGIAIGILIGGGFRKGGSSTVELSDKYRELLGLINSEPAVRGRTRVPVPQVRSV